MKRTTLLRALAVLFLPVGLTARIDGIEAPPLDVLHYRATIRFDLSAQRLDGTAFVLFRGGGDTLHLHLRDLEVTAVTRAGNTIPHFHANGILSIPLDPPAGENDTVEIAVEYGGKATDEGGTTPWGGCFWGTTTFCMGVGFLAPYVSMTRHWLPSNDVPSDKATFDLTYIVPQGMAAAGSGLLTETRDSAGWVSYRWVETHPTATYLVTYAIAPYAVIRDAWNGIPLEYYAPRTDSARAAAHFASIPIMLDAFTSAYGKYPFDKVGYCITPIGSMEHQTMISYAASLLRQGSAGLTAAHELAHQWWGDCVTPRTFGDAWLSEGFATYSEAVYLEHTGGRGGYEQRARQFISSYLYQIAPYEGVFPLRDYPRTPPSSNYPGTIYDKGAAVLVMLRQILGDETFFRGLRNYLTRHEYGTAETDDFRTVMESVSGRDLRWFFDEWVLLPGYPVYVVESVADTYEAPFRIRLLQTQDSTRFPFFTMPLDFRIVTVSGDTIRRTLETAAVPSQELTFSDVPSGTAKSVTLDPDGLVLKKVSYRTVPVERIPGASQGFRISPAYPNPIPARRGVHVSLRVETDSPRRLRIEVYDTLGRPVSGTLNTDIPEGGNTVRISLDPVAPGAYTLRASDRDRCETRTLIVVP
ncbi:MAG: M1 family aminopeptidase [Bacteroidota bacterium]|nr:M1 family aminopeptidase [Bacteroidota bacterium]